MKERRDIFLNAARGICIVIEDLNRCSIKSWSPLQVRRLTTYSPKEPKANGEEFGLHFAWFEQRDLDSSRLRWFNNGSSSKYFRLEVKRNLLLTR